MRKIDLTHREEQIIREVSKGLTNKEVASKLFISEKTVKYYMTCVMQKLHARNRVEAVTALRRHWEREAVGRLHVGPVPSQLDAHGVLDQYLSCALTAVPVSGDDWILNTPPSDSTR